MWNINDDVKGYLISASGINSSPNWNYTKNFIRVDNSKQYIISAKKDNTTSALQMNVCEYDDKFNFILRNEANVNASYAEYSKTISLNAKTKYVRLQHRNDTGMYDLQFEQSLIKTDYEPYTETQTIIQLPTSEFLAKIGDLEDYIDDKGVIHKTINKIVLDGTEEWASGGANGSSAWIAAENIKLSDNENAIPHIKSNYYETLSFNAVYNGSVGISVPHNSARIYLHRNGMSLADFKSKLAQLYESGNPVEVYYEIETPYTKELEESEKQKYLSLHLNQGVNNITCNTPISFEYAKSVDQILSEVKSQFESEVG